MRQTDYQNRQHFLLSMPPQQTRDRFLQQRQNHYQHHQQLQSQPLPQKVELSVDNSQMFYSTQQQQKPQNIRTMDIIAHSSSNPRASRNMAEKQRRDNLNTQIATMAALVPTVSTGGSRKKDKISVLRLSAAHLRIAYTLGRTNTQFLPRQFNDIDLENCLIDNLAGNSSFLIVVTTSGKIIYTSRHVEQHLGHEQLDLVGDSWYSYVYHEDHDELTRALTPDENYLGAGLANALRNNGDSLEDTSNSSEDSAQTRLEYASFREQRRNFNIRMAHRTNSRRESTQYEYLQVSGVLRLANECREQALNKSSREHHSTSNDVIFVGTARLLRKKTITELTLLEANKNEYFTRHLVDGRIIFCDHRISIIAGYMSEEVSGTSAFKFMHKDDVKWTIVALRQMYDQGNYGSSCYRLQTKNGQFIHLRTHGYLEYDQSADSIVSFICINTVTSSEEGEELINEMKKRFSATISSTVRAIHGTDDILIQQSICSVNGSENVEELSNIDDAIFHMISDLPTPVMNEDRQSISPLPNAQLVKAAIYSQRLPPASIQASRIGIKDIENSWVQAGKGGKDGKREKEGKRGNGKSLSREDESLSSSPKSLANRSGKQIAEKRIPELEECHSPVSTTTKSLPIAEKVLPTTNSAETKMYPAFVKIENRLTVSDVSTNNLVASTRSVLVSTSFAVRTNSPDCVEYQVQSENLPYQMNLKRPYMATDQTFYVSPSKKKATEDCVALNVIENSVSHVNGELSDYPGFMDVPPVALESNLQEEQANYQHFNSNQVALTTPGNQFHDIPNIQNEQLLNNAIENNSEILKIFTNLPPTIAEEGISEDVNGHEYVSNDGTVDKSKVRHAHLQVADSMSSCTSQFSDEDEVNNQVQCKNKTQEHGIKG